MEKAPRRRPGPRDWAGRSCLVLSCGLATGWAGSLLMSSWPGVPLSDQASNLLSTLGGALAGAVATYLGSTLHARGDRSDDRHVPEEPTKRSEDEHLNHENGRRTNTV